ncbi:MAG: hypothetical protein Q9160_004944 [Pyrenula sp. 1 TL-2023]
MPSVSEIRDEALRLSKDYAYTPRKLRIATIGAGFSGLTIAHKIQHQYPDLQNFVEHTIFEALEDIGGTWRVNTYPGVQCDIPAHIYAFPFDPNPDWEKFYADGDEILEYMKRTCDKWNLGRDICFKTRVTNAEWQQHEGEWKLTLDNNGQIRDEQFDILISAQGFLSRWKWPSIEGIHDFKGHKVHSASWDHSYDYSGKRIGIIGNGSSGIQILPQLAKLDGTTITSFQRGPTWITPSLGSTLGVGEGEPDPSVEDVEGVDMEEVDADDDQLRNNFNPTYTKSDKRRFNDKERHNYQKGGASNEHATKATTALMRERLNNDPDLCEKLIPKWTLGCRRLTPGEGYLESFLLPSVHLTQSPIIRITETGIQTKDEFVEVDVVVCATGFDASNVPHFPVIGRERTTLAEKWADEPESYLSLACPLFPNYFIFTGPNATVGHGTLLTSMAWSAEWMVQWIRKIATENIKSISPKQSATDEFVRSWYKNHRVDGRVTATWPGSALLYKKMIDTIRPEDFEIEYRSGNRFEFMGNGFTEYETRDDVDLAWYIETA